MSMSLQELKMVQEMQRQIAALQREADKRKQQQIQIPLDQASLRVFADAIKNVYLDSFRARAFFLETGNSTDPSVEGQIVHHAGGGTPVLKVFLNGAVRTITTS
jgi:hypothetical protein